MALIRPEFLDKNIEVLTLECPYCNGTGEMSGSDLQDDMTHCPMCDSYAKTGLWEADCGHAGCQNCITSMETPQGEWSHCEECNAEGDRCNECNDNYLWFMVGEEEVINDYHECDECNTEMCGECDEDHNPCPVTGVHRAESFGAERNYGWVLTKEEFDALMGQFDRMPPNELYIIRHQIHSRLKALFPDSTAYDAESFAADYLLEMSDAQGNPMKGFIRELNPNTGGLSRPKLRLRAEAEDTYWNPESDYDEAAMGMYGIVALTAVVFFGLTIAKGYAAGKK